ncbi:MAG: hypothetical protein D3910_21555, partial [Candidatus Electrothrix sp. ATG2]|nr:hypothetical protein [Candidatus Electrothrix sp. ATG2]
MKHFVSDFLLWLFWVPFRRLVQLLPLQVSYALAYCLALTASCLLYGMKREIAAELAEIFSEQYSAQELKKIAGQSIRLDILRRVEELFMGEFSSETIQQTVSIEGEEFLQQTLEQGKGSIILLSHFGSFLMILPALALKGYPVNQLAGPPALKYHRKINQRIFTLRKKDYSRLPITFLRADQHIKTMLMALRNNETVAMAFDGRISNTWTPVRFFNRQAYFAPGPVKIAQKTGASILPVFIVRERHNHHKLIIQKPMTMDHRVSKQDFLQTNIQRLAKVFEKMIAEHPAHFAMILHIN